MLACRREFSRFRNELVQRWKHMINFASHVNYYWAEHAGQYFASGKLTFILIKVKCTKWCMLFSVFRQLYKGWPLIEINMCIYSQPRYHCWCWCLRVCAAYCVLSASASQRVYVTPKPRKQMSAWRICTMTLSHTT